MFIILDYSSALEYSIIRRYTNIVYYYYYYLLALLFLGIGTMTDKQKSMGDTPCVNIQVNNNAI